jgi:hypothetical protein
LYDRSHPECTTGALAASRVTFGLEKNFQKKCKTLLTEIGDAITTENANGFLPALTFSTMGWSTEHFHVNGSG